MTIASRVPVIGFEGGPMSGVKIRKDARVSSARRPAHEYRGGRRSWKPRGARSYGNAWIPQQQFLGHPSGCRATTTSPKADISTWPEATFHVALVNLTKHSISSGYAHFALRKIVEKKIDRSNMRPFGRR